MLFAWTVVRHVRSNAIVIAKDGATLGIGAGQMSRVDSVRLAVEKCRERARRGGRRPARRLGRRLRRLLPLRRRPPGGDRGRRHLGDRARRLQTRRRGDRSLRRGRRGDGLHQAPPLPPLAPPQAGSKPGDPSEAEQTSAGEAQPWRKVETLKRPRQALPIHRLLRKAYVGIWVLGSDRANDESCHVADQVTPQAEHVQRKRKIGADIFIPGIEGEGRLCVCLCQLSPPAPGT